MLNFSPSANMGSLHFIISIVSIFLCLRGTEAASRRHIVFIVADDLGWNDVGFHNPDMITPNIDRLARGGLILNQSYVQPLCSPSRSAFMSGYYPFHTGLQHLVILNFQPVCLPTNITILPQHLKQLGYATHMVGKWHVGFCSWDCTPTKRGFDSFFGYYNAQEDYYTHSTGGFLDFRNDTQSGTGFNGTYSTFKFTDVATNIIKQHNPDQPLFLYLPFQAVHAPLEVPKKYEDMYPNVKTAGRKTFCGMVSSLDEAIGNITKVLEDRGMMDDTLIVFTADNGGWITESGNNYPLRGGKFTIYEGGTRGVSFVHGSGLKQTGKTFDGLMHAVDWLPTLVDAAGGEPVTGRDGISAWEALSSGTLNNRTEMIYNYDSHLPAEEGHAAIRVGDWKLIDGYPGPYQKWYKPDQIYEEEAYGSTTQYKSKANRYQLFNLKDDPTEHHDLSASNPDKVKELSTRLAFYAKQEVPANYPVLPDPKSNPQNFDNVWSPGWC